MKNQWLQLLIVLVLGHASASVHAEYGVVLGSFKQRDIAVRELRELHPAPTPLFIAVAQPDSGTHYRVIAGPFARYGDATDALAVWQGRGLADAWINQIVMPADTVPVDEIQ